MRIKIGQDRIGGLILMIDRAWATKINQHLRFIEQPQIGASLYLQDVQSVADFIEEVNLDVEEIDQLANGNEIEREVDTDVILAIVGHGAIGALGRFK